MKVALLYILGFIFFIILVYSYAGNPFKKMVLSSEINGELFLNGKGLQNVSIERELKWSWTSEIFQDRTTTKDNGTFSFPKVSRRSLSGSLLPHEPGIRQTITLNYEGRKFKLWLHTKSSYEDLYEFKGKKVILECRLENQERRDEEFDFYGICKIKRP